MDNENTLAPNQKFCHACAAQINFCAPYCPKCGAPQSVDQVPHIGCNQDLSPHQNSAVGATLKMGLVYCRGCGKEVHDSAINCPHCGAVQKNGFESAELSKRRVRVGVLAILLGSFGVHHFYLGNTGRGILYLVFFWTWIPGIVGVVEGISFLTQTDYAFSAKYG